MPVRGQAIPAGNGDGGTGARTRAGRDPRHTLDGFEQRSPPKWERWQRWTDASTEPLVGSIAQTIDDLRETAASEPVVPSFAEFGVMVTAESIRAASRQFVSAALRRIAAQ